MAEALAHGLIQHKVFKPADIIVSDVAPERRRKLAPLAQRVEQALEQARQQVLVLDRG